MTPNTTAILSVATREGHKVAVLLLFDPDAALTGGFCEVPESCAL